MLLVEDKIIRVLESQSEELEKINGTIVQNVTS